MFAMQKNVEHLMYVCLYVCLLNVLRAIMELCHLQLNFVSKFTSKLMHKGALRTQTLLGSSEL